MRGLIVDDAKSMRIFLGKILSEFGFEVLEAGDGCGALDRLMEIGKVDLVVVDWRMPEMNGLDFVRTVRMESSYNDMRLLMITGETDISEMARVLEAGADEYVMKPFSKDVVWKKLALLGFDPVGG